MERYQFYDDCALYYVTFSVVDWLPVFVSQAAMQIVTESFNFCHQNKSLRINAFVIMPTHLHAICFDTQWQAARLERTLTEFRKFTGRNMVEHCAAHLPASFVQAMESAAPEDRAHRFWQPTRHPVALTSEAMWRQKLDYLHDNPVRKGLVRRPADWRFSSATYYATDGTGPSDVQISRLVWD